MAQRICSYCGRLTEIDPCKNCKEEIKAHDVSGSYKGFHELKDFIVAKRAAEGKSIPNNKKPYKPEILHDIIPEFDKMASLPQVSPPSLNKESFVFSNSKDSISSSDGIIPDTVPSLQSLESSNTPSSAQEVLSDKSDFKSSEDNLQTNKITRIKELSPPQSSKKLISENHPSVATLHAISPEQSLTPSEVDFPPPPSVPEKESLDIIEEIDPSETNIETKEKPYYAIQPEKTKTTMEGSGVLELGSRIASWTVPVLEGDDIERNIFHITRKVRPINDQWYVQITVENLSLEKVQNLSIEDKIDSNIKVTKTEPKTKKIHKNKKTLTIVWNQQIVKPNDSLSLSYKTDLDPGNLGLSVKLNKYELSTYIV
ncbi:MAG: hypothetical protein ACFFCQ_11595 [Promethearchaeota archaeon]